MAEIITLADTLGNDGVYRLHLMSNAPIERELPPGVEEIRSVDAGTYSLKAAWRYRGPCRLRYVQYRWERLVILWAMNEGEKVSEQIVLAGDEYFSYFGKRAEFAWVRKMPAGAALGVSVPVGENEISLFDAEFVPDGFLAVGNGH